MNQLLEALGSMGDGVGFHIDNIIAGVTGKNAIVGKAGLIGACNDSALKKLCDLDDLNYTIKDYLLEIEGNLAAVARFLRDAHELRVLVADGTFQCFSTSTWPPFVSSANTMTPPRR